MQAIFPHSSIADVYGQAWDARTLTSRERQGMMSALLREGIPEEDRVAIDRMLHAVRRGWLQVLD